MRRATYLTIFVLLMVLTPHSDAYGAGHDAISSKTENVSEHESEEANPAVGADKGVLELREDGSFKVSPEAFRNFGIRTEKVRTVGKKWSVSARAILRAQAGIYVFRHRGGYFQRIPVDLSRLASGNAEISADGLTAEDEVVISGIPFLRAAELDVTGATPHGH